MELYIAEKPSVGRTIASVIGANERRDGYWEGNGRLVSWCIGHLVALAMPEAYRSDYQRWRYSDLPILPEKWQYTVVAETKKQFELLRRLMNDSRVTSLVCATDAGREGELIFRLVYAMADCRKEVRRLWISSTEESAIRQAICRMKPMCDYDNLYRAALCRAQADWLIGINATRLYSLLYGRPLPTGRVMSPALAMLVQREAAIADFHPTPFFAVKLETDPLAAKSERMDDLTEARALLECCNRAPYAVVQKIARRQRSENPPLLYDLTTLQQDANRLFGFTAQQTLDYAQSLYEKQLLTYPRTDSRYLTQDMQEKLPELAARVCRALPFASALELHLHPERVVDDSKVSDHPAIIPTAAMPAQAQRINALTTGERDLLHLVCTRLLCALEEPFAYEETAVTLVCGAHEFGAKGKRITRMGWKRIWYTFRGSLGGRMNEEEKMQENVISADLAEGMKLPVFRASIEEGKTTPPPHHTEDTLLSAMENAGKDDTPEDAERKGLGTPATRAAIIEKLVSTGFVERKRAKKAVSLVPAHTGVSLITVLPEQLQSPLLTAEWEYRLQQVERGELSPDEFMTGIADMLTELVKTYQVISGAEVLFPSGREVIGKCPRCGSDVTESKKGFFCEKNDCRFGLWRDNKFFAAKRAALTKKVATALLAEGRVKLTGLYSEKTGGTYDATAVLEDTGESVRFRLEFDKGAAS